MTQNILGVLHRQPALSTPIINNLPIFSQPQPLRRYSAMSRLSSTHKANHPHEKHPKFGHLPLSTSGPEECALKGSALLNTPYFNKGAGFPADERKTFKLTGLLPTHVSTLDQQVQRAYQQYSSRSDALAKNTFMTSLHDQNEVLYFRVSSLSRHMESYENVREILQQATCNVRIDY